MDDQEKVELSPEDIIKQRLSDLKEVVDVPGGAGKRFLRRIMEAAKIYQVTFTGNASTNFLEGRRSMALEIIADLEQVSSRDERAEILL